MKTNLRYILHTIQDNPLTKSCYSISKHHPRKNDITFLLFLMVTLWTPGTGFMPNFSIAFLLFFSDRLCFPLPDMPSVHHQKRFEVHGGIWGEYQIECQLKAMAKDICINQCKNVASSIEDCKKCGYAVWLQNLFNLYLLWSSQLNISFRKASALIPD